jgi:hypothetical protein
MSSHFDGFQDHVLPALAQMQKLEPDEYLAEFEHLRDRCDLSRTPGDIFAIAETTDILLAKWKASTDPEGDRFNNIMSTLRDRLDRLYVVCIHDKQTLPMDSFLSLLGASCNDIVVAMDALIDWIHSRV